MTMKTQILTYIAAVMLVGISAVAENKQGDSKNKKATSAEAKQPDKIVWLRYDDALKKSREENKHLLIDFTATWCGWCKRMDRDTFSKAEVIEMINENFVPAKIWDHKKDTLDIDGYKIQEKEIGKAQFGVRSYPTFWFQAPDGQKIGPIRGYLPPDQFLKALEYVKEYRYDTTRVTSDNPENTQP